MDIRNDAPKMEIKFFKGNFSLSKICLLWLSASVIFAWGCDTQSHHKKITENILIDGIDKNSTKKIRDLTSLDAEFVCILKPYQEKVSEKYPEHKTINAYLRSIKYESTEDRWAIVSTNRNKIEIYLIPRSTTLDIADKSMLGDEKSPLPHGFEAQDCSPIDEAAFYKFFFNNRNYIVFGRKK